MFLGLDTSNYTTSAAAFSPGIFAENVSRLLPVKNGELGLRQSDTLFHHVCRLPEIVDTLFAAIKREPVKAVAASTRPRAVEGSYMPCFHAGDSFGRSLASVLQVPFFEFSHQQGHIASVLYSAGRLDLLRAPHLAWHLSGGTTELLLVEPENSNLHCRKIGGTTDISAGQAIDRAGKMLNLPFPSGKALDELCSASDTDDCFSPKLNGLEFSLSGLQNKTADYLQKGAGREDTARYVLNSVADIVYRTTKAARKDYPGYPVIFSGGVSSNSLLRTFCASMNPIFSEPKYSTDNAMGIAVLCSLQEC